MEHPKPAPEDGVHHFIFERCVLAPYGLRAAWLVTTAGYYPEGATLVRHLLETFVRLRYFAKHPEKLFEHLDPGQKARITFRTMFDELSPGYYVKPYRTLSTIAHGGIGLSAFSGMEYQRDDTGKATAQPHAGVTYDPKRSSFVTNQMMELISGYLRCFPSWFPTHSQRVDTETERRRTGDLSTLAEWRKGLEQTHPKTSEWLKQSQVLMGGAAS